MNGGELIISAALNIAPLNLSTILSRLIIILSTTEHVRYMVAAHSNTKLQVDFLAI